MRKYGWKPDLPDIRDLSYLASGISAPIPNFVDLRSGCSPVEDQGELGSCTSQAISGAIEFLDKQKSKPVDVSRLFIYYQERVIENTVPYDAGASIRDGIKSCASLGVPLESLWPYNVKKFAKKPTVTAYSDAAKRKIMEYYSVQDLYGMLQWIAKGIPVIFGFSVYQSFESEDVARTGLMPMPSKSERLLGGHAVLAVGYDQSAQRLIVRNSWGINWGIKGYFTMPFNVIQGNMADDFWIITK